MTYNHNYFRLLIALGLLAIAEGVGMCYCPFFPKPVDASWSEAN